MAEVIPIQVKITPENVDQTKRKIIRATEQIEDQAQKTGREVSKSIGGGFEGALNRLKRSARSFVQVAKGVGLVGLLFAVADGLVRIATAIPATIKLFDDLSNSLRVVTVSASDANIALEILLDLAEQTSTPVNELAGAFSRLRLLGLDPTNETLTNFAALARGLSKDLNQVTEAVADAVTGEFERLKELGFAYSRQGRQVELTFRGVTQTIAINAEAIQGYLEDIGRTQFADVFEQQANSINTALSDLRVAFQALIRDVAGDTLTGLFTRVVNTFTLILRWIQNQFLPEFKLAWLSISEFVESQWEIISSIVTFNLSGLEQRLQAISNEYSALRLEVTSAARERATEISTLPGAVDQPGGGGGGAVAAAQQEYLDSWRTTEEQRAQDRYDAQSRAYDILIQQDEQYARQASTVLNTATDSWRRGLENFISAGKLSFKSLIDGMISDLARLGVNRIFQTLIGGTTGTGGLSGLLGGLFSNAKGNVVKRYAQGGIIDKPTIFPARRGMALAGEAGAEAIMPLRRDRRGNLGVSGQTAGTVNNFYINAIDTQSFAEAARRSGAIPSLVAEDIGNNGVARNAVLNAR